MRNQFITTCLLLFLTGCQSESQQDYSNCNKDWAKGDKCTRNEFREYLYYKANEQAIIGDLEDVTYEVYGIQANKINDKVNEIFGEEKNR
ncbi:hypothetical protein ACFOU2_06245 [Bacillus songklensis]|uniref:Lipoprotein n=1 Tax=Bacillus songklensis TaxID=1069116 RepID=A0ABV8AZN2_9BACI